MSEPENIILRMLRELRAHQDEQFADIRQRLDRIEAQLGEQKEELNIASSLALRATGERVAWNTVNQALKKLTARVEALEAKGRS